MVSFGRFRKWGKSAASTPCPDFTPSFHNFVDCIISAPNLQTSTNNNFREFCTKRNSENITSETQEYLLTCPGARGELPVPENLLMN